MSDDKMNPVVHFEMGAKDRQRMANFYTKVFGWQTHMLGEDMGNYVVVHTTETDENNMVKTTGTINGGFFQASDDNQPPSVVISVEDIYQAMKDVTAAGGTVLGGHLKDGNPDDIPGIGLYASFIDTEGNRVTMLQAKR